MFMKCVWRAAITKHNSWSRLLPTSCSFLPNLSQYTSNAAAQIKNNRAVQISRGNENRFAYDVVKQAGITDIYVKTPVTNLLDCDNVPLEKITATMSDLSQLSLEELVTLITILDTRHRESPQFDQWLTALDVEGAKRVPFGDPGVVLAGAMKLYEANLFFKSEWVWSCLKRFCRRPDRLDIPQMLQMMFLVNIMRRIPIQYSGFDVQHRLVPFFDNLTLDQMAVVSVAFFKSQTKMNNEVIMSKVMRKLLDECKTANAIALAMISKIIRYSLPLSLADELYMVQDTLTGVVPDLDPRCLTHVVLSGTNALVCHEPFIRAVARRFTECLEDMRLKDFERMLLVLSLFNIHEEDLVNSIIEEVGRRQDEILTFPKALVCLTNYLIVMSKFDFELIDRVLSKKFINETYDRNLKTIGGELIFIDQSVGIERPDYPGNRLSHSVIRSSAKVMSFSAQSKASGTQRFSYELEGVLFTIYGRENIVFNSLLPHFHFPDLILGISPDGSPCGPTNREWCVHRWGEVKHPPDPLNSWLVFVVGGWNTSIRNTNKPLGTLNTKIRQLKLLGFHPIIVPYNEWRTSTDKTGYVKNLVDRELMSIKELKQEKNYHGCA